MESQHLQSELSKTFRKDHGPFVKVVDKALQSFRVQRQAYYSGTFVGNHCHTSLKVSMVLSTILPLTVCIQAKNITTLCQSIVELATSQCPTLVPEATAVGEKFKELFLLFSKCHAIYDQNYVTDTQITQLGT